MTGTVVVASRNPVKIASTRQAFARVFGDLDLTVEGLDVPSGVPPQPVGDPETLRGARQRAREVARRRPAAAYWVGIEGGVAEHGGSMIAFAWVVVARRGGGEGQARTASFPLPPAVVELVRAGHELGDANDRVFGRVGSKQGDGAVGLLTDNLIDRTQLYEPAVVLALIPLRKPALFTG